MVDEYWKVTNSEVVKERRVKSEATMCRYKFLGELKKLSYIRG
jgi:hypothetical protein